MKPLIDPAGRKTPFVPRAPAGAATRRQRVPACGVREQSGAAHFALAVEMECVDLVEVEMGTIDLSEFEMASIDLADVEMATIDLSEFEKASIEEVSQASPNLVPAPEMEFETQIELKTFIEGFARRTGCRIIIKFKTFAKASRSVELFGHEGAWARGDGYCNFKKASEKPDRSVKSSCTLNIPFTYDTARRKYVIKGDRFCLAHNHPVEIPPCTTAVVNDQRDLTPEQLSYIMSLGKYPIPFPMVTRMLADQFPNCRVQKPLLHRLLRKGKLEAFGGDPDAMNLLVNLGRSYEGNGGVFEIDIDVDCRLEKIWLARAEGLLFASAYNDVVQIDGGAKMNAYGFIFLPVTVIDCLGKSYVVGAMAGPSAENKQDVVKTLEYFQVKRGGSVLIADDALAFRAAATECGMIYHQCTKHYQAKIARACAGLGHDAKEFMAKANTLIYQIFPSEDAFLAKANEYRFMFLQYDGAVKLFDDIVDRRQHLCRTFTSLMFTGSHSSNQRAEGTISRTKRGVQPWLSRANLFELFSHLETIQKHQDDEAARILSDLIRKGKPWSNYVDSMLRERQLNSRLLNSVREVDIGAYEVGTSDQPDRHRVLLNDVSLGNIPSCSCSDFRSTLIPCSGICAVFNRTQDDIFSLQYVHRRWWLRLHPHYETVRRSLRVPDAVAAQGDLALLPEHGASYDDVSNDEPAVAVRASQDDVYHRVVYPSKQDVRYRKLSEAFGRLVHDARSNEHLYRRLMSTFASLQTEFQSHLAGSRYASDSQGAHPAVRPPLRQGAMRGRPPDRVQRTSRLDTHSGTLRQVAMCHTCLQNGVTATDHRSGRKCPFHDTRQQDPGTEEDVPNNDGAFSPHREPVILPEHSPDPVFSVIRCATQVMSARSSQRMECLQSCRHHINEAWAKKRVYFERVPEGHAQMAHDSDVLFPSALVARCLKAFSKSLSAADGHVPAVRLSGVPLYYAREPLAAMMQLHSFLVDSVPHLLEHDSDGKFSCVQAYNWIQHSKFHDFDADVGRIPPVVLKSGSQLPCLDASGLPAQEDFAALMPLDDLLVADSLIECPTVVDPRVDMRLDPLSKQPGPGEDRDPGIMFPGSCDSALSYKLVVIMTRLHEAVMMQPRVRQFLDWLLTFEGRPKGRRQPPIPLDGLDAEGMAQFVMTDLWSPMRASDISKVVKLTVHDLIFHLADRSWLNSSVVHEAMALISRGNAHVASCRVEMNDDGRWGIFADLDSSATMFVCPVNFGNLHWCLVVVDAARGLVYLYDSLCDPVYTARLQSIATSAVMPWAASAFPGAVFEARILSEPRQVDDYNCGMYVLTVAEALARNLPLKFKASCIEIMRLRWVYWFMFAEYMQ